MPADCGAVGAPDARVDVVEEAERYIQRGHHAAALQLLDRAQDARGLHQRAVCHFALNNVEEASRALDAALEQCGTHAGALQAKGELLLHQQRPEEARPYLEHALRLDPSPAKQGMLAKCHLKRALANPPCASEAIDAALALCPNDSDMVHECGLYVANNVPTPEGVARAETLFRRVLELKPDHAMAQSNLGSCLRQSGNYPGAIDLYRASLVSDPGNALARSNLAECLWLHAAEKRTIDPQASKLLLQEALRCRPLYAEAYFGLGCLQLDQREVQDAAASFELSVQLSPSAQAFLNLSMCYLHQRRAEDAIQALLRGLRLTECVELWARLAVLRGLNGQQGMAIEAARAAVRLAELQTQQQGGLGPRGGPRALAQAEAYNTMALTLRDSGDVESAELCFRRSLTCEPWSPYGASNRLMTLCYLEEEQGWSSERVYLEHKRWGEGLREGKRLQPVALPDVRDRVRRRRLGDDRLRVAYVSADFFYHSVSYFIHAALQFADRSRFRVTCYSSVETPDAKTQLFMGLVEDFRSVKHLDDAGLAQLVLQDEIDILVDLGGHTGCNRLAVFDMKPAPIQVTWIGYPHTTGVKAIDYRITDAVADPPGAPERCVEELVRLPSFLCYTPADGAPACIPDLPADKFGAITFVSCNNLAKISPATVRMWAQIMKQVPSARLLLKSKPLACPVVQQFWRRRFAAHGVSEHQIDVSGLIPGISGHLDLYARIADIALEPTPYAGTTTTCETLYMGVPVITLSHPDIHSANVPASLCTTIGHPELIASSEEEYIRIACDLAMDLPRLRELRTRLRPDMQASLLMRGAEHTRLLEDLFGKMADRYAGVEAQDPSSTAVAEALPPDPVEAEPASGPEVGRKRRQRRAGADAAKARGTGTASASTASSPDKPSTDDESSR